MGFLDRLFGTKKSAHAQFTEDLAEAMRAIAPEARLAVHAEELKIEVQLPGTEGMWLCNVHNIWEEAQRFGDADAVIAAYAPRLMASEEVTADNVRDRLMVKLQPRRIVEQARLQHGDEAVDGLLLLREITPDLFAMLAIDRESQIANANRTQLEEFGITVDEAWNIALANLRKRSNSAFEEIIDGVYSSTWDDTYDGARLMLPDLLDEMVEFEGDMIAIVPNRYQLVLVDACDHEAQRHLVGITDVLMDLDRPMQLAALRREGRGWREVDPSRDDDLDPALFMLKRYQDDLDYRFVQDCIVDNTPALGMVSPINVMLVGEVPCTMTGLPVGVAASLPKVDVIAFMNEEEPIVVSWPALERELGDTLEQQDTWPAYYRMDRPPALDTIRRLAAEA